MNVLYKVWGIITFVFTAFYAVGWLIFFILLGVGGSKAKGLTSMVPSYVWWAIEDEYSQAVKYIILIILLLALIVLIGLLVRILAGLYLVRDYVKSRGALITVAVFYFIITALNLLFALSCGKTDLLGFVFFFLFCAGWGSATAVFLILKQSAASAQGTGYYEEPALIASDTYIPYTKVGVQSEYEPQGSIKGLFGDFIGKKYTLRPGETCKIGRDSGCDIQIKHRKVSRIHCLVKFLPDGRFEVMDISYNGTFYENEALPNGVAVTVNAGGNLVIGEADNVLALHVE